MATAAPSVDVRFDHLPPELREQAERRLAKFVQAAERNPLELFHACPKCCGFGCQKPTERNPQGGRPKQHAYMAAQNKIVAEFAGNQFGKTCANVVWAVVQHTPEEALPERLKPFKHVYAEKITGRYLVPTQRTFETIVIPELQKWLPDFLLRDGKWDKAYSKQHNILYFADGGRLELFTYEQDAKTMVGAINHYVVYDEPPPVEHFRECWMRTVSTEGPHRFALTPVNMTGGGVGWLKRDIFDAAKRGDEGITVLRASIHDNPSLTDKSIAETLKRYPDDQRQAREFGDFIHFGGMVYPGAFEDHLKPEPKDVKDMDVVVGIDPGLKNAAFVWIAFDNDNRALVFDEALVQEGTPIDYASTIKDTNEKWGVKPEYVIDPSARNRSLVNAESMEGELGRQGIYCVHGQNAVQAGVQQVRRRLQEQGLFIAETCTGIREEAEEYRMEDRPDGEFKIVKENDHRLDALRYALMHRPWYPGVQEEQRHEPWQWTPGTAPSQSLLTGRKSRPPMGAMS